ncbi:ribosomal subunit interface protein [Catellatospora sp. TT07R-123]|uniref:ribosome hibernation-promoting factor, HPF/YfiA family n=1 Tax=Catellatospora sp. TT07R-123 TaxID=2733863 RepID=UPI001B096FC6|nr:ribosome-associated translation inhibitor RaiA [Catellatospora sp. TT07R-123]GHJ45759.1 ribosomal subunit interface protein [Catellatospora sp. TT07R-123]
MDIEVKGRNVEVPEHYKVHVADKLQKIERYDQKIIEIDVELIHERNPRQVDSCQHVEITCVTRGPVIRAVGAAGDFYSALDQAIERLDRQMRKAADRRRVHRGRRAPISVAAATAGLPLFEPPGDLTASLSRSNGSVGTMDDEEQPWHIVREKEFSGEPMTIDDALYQMELVGHDFYLFHDKDSGRPCVVYRRRAYDYGLLTLAW